MSQDNRDNIDDILDIMQKREAEERAAVHPEQGSLFDGEVSEKEQNKDAQKQEAEQDNGPKIELSGDLLSVATHVDEVPVFVKKTTEPEPEKEEILKKQAPVQPKQVQKVQNTQKVEPFVMASAKPKQTVEPFSMASSGTKQSTTAPKVQNNYAQNQQKADINGATTVHTAVPTQKKPATPLQNAAYQGATRAMPRVDTASSSFSPAPAPTPKDTPLINYDAFSSSTVSLSDFDTISKPNPKTAAMPKQKRRFYIPRYVKVFVYLCAVFAVSIYIAITAIKIGNEVFAFLKPQETVEIYIPEGAKLSDVAKELSEKGVIAYPELYELYVNYKTKDSTYYKGTYKSGSHLISKSLSYDDLIAALAETNYTNDIVRITIPEGHTVYEIVDLFVSKGVVSEENKERFIEKLNSLSYDFDFLPKFAEGEGNDRIYMLEGYLFPDTYDFYINENLDSIINKFLVNFDRKFEEEYYERAKELGLTLDEVITLASMIEAEGNTDRDFYLISSVFHNRLNNANYGKLDSDATTLYSFQGSKKVLDAGDNQNRIHPYNTYLNRGLPPGPICNPGTEAIHAALYPEESSYYYFYTAATNGITYYSKNKSQHDRYIAADLNGTIGQE